MTEERTVLAWRIHRVRDEPHRVPGVAAAYGGAFVAWWLVFPHPLALAMLALGLTGALSEFLLPVEYRLTTRGAHCHCGPLIRLFLAWEDVQRATVGNDGVFLSPLRRASRLDGFRGVRLRFAAHNAHDVRETARRLWQEARP